jgi:hypothetical protein
MHHAARAARRLATVCIFAASSAGAQVTPPAGWIYGTQQLNTLTQNCIAAGPGGTFVAIGPGFTPNAQAVVLVRESGDVRLVAFGFNSIGDCVWDRDSDILYISDNADNADFPGPPAIGAISGDTIFAVPSASTAAGLLATDLELLPSGSIEFASSLAIAASGDLLVGNSAGAGNGTVLRIDSGNALSTFAAGFDFTGGIAIDGASGDVFVAETTSSFDVRLSRLSAAGAPVAVPLLGPTFDLGSSDLVLLPDGRLLATGVFFGDVVAIDPSVPSSSPFASGLTYAGGATVDPFTGRVSLLSSSFTGAAEDKSLHRFTPVDRLTPGTGSDRTECLHEIYGIELVAPEPGRPAKKAICEDGAPCDTDGLVNDQCLFPVGVCLNVFDLRFPECATTSALTEFELTARPASAAIVTLAAAVSDALPIAGGTPSCFYSDGIVVPVRTGGSGAAKPGKAKVMVAVVNADGDRDRDTFGLVCEPAAP